MLWWGRKNQDLRKDKALLKLDKSLRALFEAEIHPSDDTRIRAHVLGKIDRLDQELIPLQLDLLGLKVSALAKKVRLSAYDQMALKERILDRIDHASSLQRTFGVNPSFKPLKMVLSSVLLFFFVVTTIVVFPFQVPFTYAARATYLEAVQGSVFVVRAGQFLTARKNFTLREGDVVVTKKNGAASVRFFDDSISRLDANTQLELKRIYSEPFNPVATQVELALEEGRIWSKVLNLVNNNSHFLVSTDKASAVVSKKAVFNMENNTQATSVSVYENVVDFSLKGNVSQRGPVILRSKPVVAGFHAEVSKSDPVKIDQITVTSTAIEPDDSNKNWIALNLEKDKAHELAVVSEKEQSLQASTPHNDFIFLDHPDDAHSPLTNGDLEKMRQQISAAYTKMLAGESALLKGDQGGLASIKEFKDVVNGVMKDLPTYEKEDPLNAGLLRTFLSSKISQQRKNLATFLPEDSLYQVKEIIEEAELLLAKNDFDKAELQLSHAEDVLFVLQDLIQKNQYDQADKLLTLFKMKMDAIVLKTGTDTMAKVNSGFGSLLEEQVDQLKVLTALQKTLPAAGRNDLAKRVFDIRNNLVKKLMLAVVTYGDRLPADMIQQLQGLLETYMTDEQKHDEVYVAVLKNISLQQESHGTDGSQNPLESGLTDNGTVTVLEEQSTLETQTQFVESKPL